MIEEKYAAAIETRSRGEACISFLPKSGDQVHRHAKVVQWYNASHRGPVAPERSTQDVHTMNGIGSEPCPSGEVSLGDDVEPFNICEIEWMRCWNLPDGMKDSANLPHKKTFHVRQHQGTAPIREGTYRPIQEVVARVHLHRLLKKLRYRTGQWAIRELVGMRTAYVGEGGWKGVRHLFGFGWSARSSLPQKVRLHSRAVLFSL